MYKIVLAVGGTGGHFFPAVAVAEEIRGRAPDAEIIFASGKKQRMDPQILEGRYNLFRLPAVGMPGKFSLKTVSSGYKMAQSVIKSYLKIRRIRPDAVVGFGSYLSVGPVIAAKMMKIPIFLHEANLVLGRANRFLRKYAGILFCNRRPDGIEPNRCVEVGMPLRKQFLEQPDKAESRRKLGLVPDRPAVVIMGGSQGCSFLNETVSLSARIMNEKVSEEKAVQFIHLTGKKDFERIKKFYEENSIPGKVFSFLESIKDAYSVTDLAITRSGAAAIFELAFCALPMILVPYPNSKNSQKSNAEYFSKKGGAILREEGTFSSQDLAREVVQLLFTGTKLEDMAKASRKLSVPDAGKKLADEVIRVGARHAVPLQSMGKSTS